MQATGEDGASTSAAPKVAAAAEEASKAESSAKTEWEPKPPRNPERKLKDFEEVQQVIRGA